MGHISFGHRRQVLLAATLVAAALSVTACGGNKNVRGDAPGMPQAGMNGQGQGQGQGMGSGRDIDVRGLEGIPAEDRHLFTDPNNPLSTRTVYFDLDSSAIPSRFSQAIQAHGQYLANHPNVNLRLEGNTDERGTREYNVALGERRADSVKQAVVLSGASAGQVTTISYGEERPAVLGQDAESMNKNRRVDFIYTNN